MNQLGLGEILQLRGWITRQQLNRALAQQRRFGGRLGTSLLEIGAVSEDQLLTVLATQTGVPKGPIEGLRELPRELGKLVPAELARRRRLLPVEATRDCLSVAFENPRDLTARDELAFVTDKRIQPLGLHEARIHEGLERLYGFDCPTRFSRLLKELDRRRSVAGSKDAPSSESIETPSRRGHGALDGADPVAGTVPTPQPRGPRQAAPAAGTVPRPRLRIVELSESERNVLTKTLDREALAALPVEQRLLRVSRASQVGEALLDHLEKAYLRVALLRCEKDGFRGWLASGMGLDPRTFSDFRVDAKQPSVFIGLHLGGSFYLGPLSRHETNRRFLSSWQGTGWQGTGWQGDAWPRTCALIPLRSHRQTLAVIYVDTPRDSSAIDLASLQALAAQAVKAFENCILRNRLASQDGKILV